MDVGRLKNFFTDIHWYPTFLVQACFILKNVWTQYNIFIILNESRKVKRFSIMWVALHNASTITKYCMSNKSLITLLVIANTLFHNTREDSTHGHHQMVNTKIRLIICFAAKDGEALYSQQKQDQELTVAQIVNSL